MAEQKTQPEPQKKSSKMFIFIPVGVIVLAGAVVAVLFFTGVIGGHRGAAAGTESQARANQSTQTSALKSTVDLEPFVVNLADPETARYLKVKMVIELNNETMKAQVDKLKPKIQDTIILLLTSKTFEQIRDGKGKLKLKQELTLRLNEILGAGAVSDVLFTEFIVS